MDAEPTTSSTDAATRTGATIFLAVGFVVFDGVRLGQAIWSGEPGVIATGVIGFAFWGWLTWRLVLLVRPGSVAGEDPDYWRVTGTGYVAFLVLGLAVRLWRLASGQEVPPASWIGVAVMAVLVLSAWSGWKGARRRQVAATDAKT